MIIGVAADHGGFDLKEKMKAFLQSKGYEVKDFGAHVLDAGDDYPDFVLPLAIALKKGEFERAIAICGSGVGASIAANKITGVRAALVHDTFSAHQGVEDDDMNMICLGGRIVGEELAKEIIVSFLKASFTKAERHQRRLQKVLLAETNKQS